MKVKHNTKNIIFQLLVMLNIEITYKKMRHVTTVDEEWLKRMCQHSQTQSKDG